MSIPVFIIYSIFVLVMGTLAGMCFAHAEDAPRTMRLGVMATITNEQNQVTGYLKIGDVEDAPGIEECTNYVNTSDDSKPMLRVLHLFGPHVRLECVAVADKPAVKTPHLKPPPSVEADKHT